ncbi:phosphotransferase [Streptomyces sp. NPDC047928]|uniref:phosphotransferase n=1 Tax=unclassified Streptomyces TaxID=2593676 RepID=UPI00371D8B73
MSVVGPLTGGVRNEVLEVRLGGDRLVARRSRRGAAALAWELDLLAFLGRHGFTVPGAVRAPDGRRHVDGVVVQRWLDGDPPGVHDWPAVAAELRRLHTLTRGRPQRPGFRSCRDLPHTERGGDVDLTVMPRVAVEVCRGAWRALPDVPQAVVHGDPAPGDIRVTATGIGLLDWDEARVDCVDLDLADLPVPSTPAGPAGSGTSRGGRLGSGERLAAGAGLRAPAPRRADGPHTVTGETSQG